jgi:hypothetical protein
VEKQKSSAQLVFLSSASRKITANVRKQRQENEKWNKKIMERRTVLKGGVAAVGMLGGGASSAMVAGDAISFQVRQIGEAFNTVAAHHV